MIILRHNIVSNYHSPQSTTASDPEILWPSFVPFVRSLCYLGVSVIFYEISCLKTWNMFSLQSLNLILCSLEQVDSFLLFFQNNVLFTLVSGKRQFSQCCGPVRSMKPKYIKILIPNIDQYEHLYFLCHLKHRKPVFQSLL